MAIGYGIGYRLKSSVSKSLVSKILKQYTSDNTDDIVIDKSMSKSKLLKIVTALYNSLPVTHPNNILFTNYKDDIDDIINADADEQGSDVERIAFFIDELFEESNFEKDIYLKGVGIGLERAVYGIEFRDLGKDVSGTYQGFYVQRVGSLENFGNNDTIPEHMLTVHNKMRRCVVTNEGVLRYYLDPENSMWRLNSSKKPASTTAEITPEMRDGTIDIEGIVDLYGNAHDVIDTYQDNKMIWKDANEFIIPITMREEDGEPVHVLSADDVGKICHIYGTDASHLWYAIITAVDTVANTITLSHPHIQHFGQEEDGEGGWVYQPYFIIGDARLNGAHGQVMVEIPGFWHKHTYEPALDDDTASNYYVGTQTHLISLRQFDKDAKYYAPRYISAFEGVAGDSEGVGQGGWEGKLNIAATPSADGGDYFWSDFGNVTATTITSTAGHFPRTYLQLGANYTSGFKKACTAIGNDYHQYDFASNFILQLFMVIEVAGFDTQTKIGYGVANVGLPSKAYNGLRPLRKTGDSIPGGNKTWDMTSINVKMNISTAFSSQMDIRSLSYRGIENPYGHIYKLVDGFFFIRKDAVTEEIPLGLNGMNYYDAYATAAAHGGEADFENYKIMDETDDDFPGVYEKLDGLNGNPLRIPNNEHWWKNVSPNFLPNDDNVTGLYTKYHGDFFYCDAGTEGLHRVFAVGGSAYFGAYAGAFCVHSAYHSGSAANHYGGRLCRKK